MNVYVALLRGINVGGHKNISMAELKQALTESGFERVKTYIQSGNVLFASPLSAEEARARTEAEIAGRFGMKVHVVLRTAEQFERLMADCPYDASDLAEGESIHVTLSNDVFAEEKVRAVLPEKSGRDEYAVLGSEIYFCIRQSVRDSGIMDNLQKLGGSVTTRNWNTMSKLLGFAGELSNA